METPEVSDDQSDSRFRFLDLPPELRNTIYGYILVEGDVTIQSPALTSTAQPPLLEVNRQIRGEAYDIYYQENRFIWHIRDFKATKFIKWQQASGARRMANTKIFLRGVPVWSNISEWLEAFYQDKVIGLDAGDRTMKRSVAATVGMFELVSELKMDGLRWERIKCSLESARKAVGGYSERWLR